MTSLGFGGQQNTQPAFGGFSFGASTNTPAPNATTQPTVSTALGSTPFGGFGGAITSQAPSTSLFPSSTATTASGTSTFPNFAQPATSAAAPAGLSFGGFGNPASTAGMTFGTGSLVPAPSAATSVSTSIVGLGGVDIQTSGVVNGSNASNKKESKAGKESQIPNEIAVTVESFKKYVKEQKAIREEMSRVSNKNIFKVQELVGTLKQQLSVVSNGLHRNAVAIAKLKEESNLELKNAEIAQRTKDSLSSLQYENNAPTEYFHNLASSFEKQMQSYRLQIEQLERHLLSLSEPYTLTPDEWASNRKRLHDTFVTLAAQLQTVHQEIQMYKEHFINSQKVHQVDVRMYIEKCQMSRKEQMHIKHLPNSVSYGPSPFKPMQSVIGKTISNVFNGSQKLSGGSSSFGYQSFESGVANRHLFMQLNTNQISGFQSVTPFKPLGDTGGMSLFGSSSLGGASTLAGDSSGQLQFGVDNQKPFQLQKPPAGNKRGKRWTST